MKTTGNICLTFFLTALLVACSSDKQEQTQQTNGMNDTYTSPVRELCFLQVTQSKPTLSGTDTLPGIVDSLLINLTFRDTLVTGILNWLPAQKDRMTGTLQGTLQDSIITAIYTYQAEGITAKEERIFRLEPDTIRMKAGEMEEKNGIWVLKHKDEAPYSIAVPRVVCP